VTPTRLPDVTVRDPNAFAAYRICAAPSIAKFGGRYLVRGAVTALEGRRHPTMLVVVEFPDRAAAEPWYASAEYGEALKSVMKAPAVASFSLAA
jgi:uncharacterized protein (DUF1330 family)